jgi:hypothetical protein
LSHFGCFLKKGRLVKLTTIVLFIAAFVSSPVFARGGGGGGHSGGSHSSSVHSAGSGSHSIKGYTKKNGTHVAPSRATNPNKSKRDNWTAKGNANPHTGKEGTKDPVTGK